MYNGALSTNAIIGMSATFLFSKFKSKDEAQRKFLKDGGPYKDRFNLDPDGDGFACDWDPEIYRKLSIPND